MSTLIEVTFDELLEDAVLKAYDSDTGDGWHSLRQFEKDVLCASYWANSYGPGNIWEPWTEMDDARLKQVCTLLCAALSVRSLDKPKSDAALLCSGAEALKGIYVELEGIVRERFDTALLALALEKHEEAVA